MHGTPNGYVTIVVFSVYVRHAVLSLLGIIEEYIAILFTELKDRPIYIVKDTENIPSGSGCGPLENIDRAKRDET